MGMSTFRICFTNTSHIVQNRFCSANSVNANLVKGKVLVCDSVLPPSRFVNFSDAVGVIMNDGRTKDSSGSYPLPSSYLTTADGNNVKTYMSSNGCGCMLQHVHKMEILILMLTWLNS